MNKNKLLTAAIFSFFFLASCNTKDTKTEATTNTEPATETVTYAIAPDSSLVKWKGIMLGIKEHFGTLALKEGTLNVSGGQLNGGSFIFDMTSIKPTDSNYDVKSGATPEKLVGHLTSPDFFDVANHPTSTFTIDSVNGNEAKGTLTIRGKSNQETLKNITITEENGTMKASGTLTYDRKKYDVSFDMPMKDMVISNDIEMTIELSGTTK